MDHTVLELLEPRPIQGTNNFTWNIGIGYDQKNTNQVTGTINDQTFIPDQDHPTVTKVMYVGDYVSGKELGKDQNAYTYDNENVVVEITLINK